MKDNNPQSRIAWTLTVCTALALFGDSTIYAVLPAQYGALAITTAHVGWLLSINRLVRLPLNFISGSLCERMGSKWPYVVGVAVGVMSTATYGLMSGFLPLLAARALWGVAWSLLSVAAYGMILDVTGTDNRGRLTGFYASYSFFGGSLGMLLGGFLVDMLGFSAAMLVLSACTAMGFLASLSLPHMAPVEREAVEPNVTQCPPLPVRIRGSLLSARKIRAEFWVIASLYFAHRFFFAGVFYSTFGFYLSQVLGERVSVAGWVMGIASLTSTLLFVRNVTTIIAAPVLGHLSDRLRDRAGVLLLGEAVGVLALTSFAFTGTFPVIAAGVILAAVAYGVVPPLLIAWLGDLTRAGSRGRYVGGYQSAGDLGSGLGPLFSYYLLPRIGIQPVYALSAAFLFLTIPLILRVRHNQKVTLPGD